MSEPEEGDEATSDYDVAEPELVFEVTKFRDRRIRMNSPSRKMLVDHLEEEEEEPWPVENKIAALLPPSLPGCSGTDRVSFGGPSAGGGLRETLS